MMAKNKNKTGFFISKKDLNKMERWLKSKKGQKKMREILSKIKPETELEKWQKNHEQAEWWAKIKNVPFTI